MAKVKKILVVASSALFAMSLVLQVCCHQGWPELFARNSEKTTAHSHSHDKKSHDQKSSPQDDCGTHQFKDLFKPDKVTTSANLSISSFALSLNDWLLDDLSQAPEAHSFRLVFFNKAGPPLYLLNSVFLN